MINAKMAGKKAWCGRQGCGYTFSLATISPADDGTLYARLTGQRWRRNGSTNGMERYETLERTGRRVSMTAGGQVHRQWTRGTKPQCPIVVVCPGCDSVQTIGLPPPSLER